MAGFFGLFDYSKPGKGVDKDAPPKHAFFLFWELIWRKLSRLILINIIYFLSILPMVAFLYSMLYNYVSTFDAEIIASPLASLLFSMVAFLPAPVYYFLLAVSCLIYGPITCGFSYILRNMARQEHSWLSDFFTKSIQNFKQGMFFGLMEIFIFALFFINYNINSTQENLKVTSLARPAYFLTIVSLVFLSFMRNYYYIMVVTFELKVTQIIKNSLIFSVLGLFRNLLVNVVVLATGVAVMFFGWIEVVLVPIFIFSFWGFLSVFSCYGIIKKYMIDKAENLPAGDNTT